MDWHSCDLQDESRKAGFVLQRRRDLESCAQIATVLPKRYNRTVQVEGASDDIVNAVRFTVIVKLLVIGFLSCVQDDSLSTVWDCVDQMSLSIRCTNLYRRNRSRIDTYPNPRQP